MCKGMKTRVLGGSVSSSEWLDKALDAEIANLDSWAGSRSGVLWMGS